MKPITEEEEKRIDKSKLYYGELRYIQGDIHITAKNIYMYGEFDTESDDDLDLVERFKLIDKNGAWVYSNFDYDKGTYTTIEGRRKGAPTFDPIKWFMYAHNLIGKPKRIIVYNNCPIRIK